jgi:tripartite-type tricarboxylate transporter receptor subunit TctC
MSRDSLQVRSGRFVAFARRCVAGIAACSLAAFATAPAAQTAPEFPRAPVRLVVPFPPGGPTDLLARILVGKLNEIWSQPVVVEYKPGAGTVIGVDFVAKSAPDGHTIALVNSAYTINPLLLKKMPYDTLRDLTGVTQVTNMTMAFVAAPSVPFDTVPQLVDWARKNPGKLSFATPGAGGTAHLLGELLNRAAGIDLLHVPYKGSSPAHSDVIGGRVELMFDPLFSVLQHVRAGKMKVVALASERRVPNFEQYPVIAEQYPSVTGSALLGLVVPAATPKAVIDRIQADVARSLDTPAERKRIAELGMDVVASTPAQFDAFIRAEMAKWGKVVREANIRIEQ